MSLRERIFAAAYDRVLAQAELHWLGERRETVVGDVDGTVLEIGAGTGANLGHYRTADRVVMAEPVMAMQVKAATKLHGHRLPVTLVSAGAESLPYPDGHFDAVVSTLVLCTVADLDSALDEIRRVVKDGGEFRFLEHVRGEGALAEWQDRLQPVWTWFAVGCRPNRDILTAIERAGFGVEEIERFESPDPVPLVRPHIQGVARA